MDTLFMNAGAPGPPPDLSHTSKWKEWLFSVGMNPDVDSLGVLGSVLEEFMDLPPADSSDELKEWKINRERIEQVLEENGLRYFRFGRILPQGSSPQAVLPESSSRDNAVVDKPTSVEELLLVIVGGLRRAMHPLTHRRKDAQNLEFSSEYDVQDLLHALLRPWISDIRPEEFTPSYAGSSTRMDFLLPAHGLVMELKFVRNRSHARKIGDELIIDIDHYQAHPECKILWCVIYDQEHFLTNGMGLRTDLEGKRFREGREVEVKVIIV
ncbi:hypothetical protein [Roseibacillus persicicus]|uniref:PD-(D/E)XK nuclease domain-containing protein n=1 Tax=Roseibacillus persicicus TaxID=454148 RepID=UPI00281226CB|nr:hypothetical protein [Roseibacillus persicicus]